MSRWVGSEGREREREREGERERTDSVKCNSVLWHDNPVTRETNVQECDNDESTCNLTLSPQLGPALCPS